MEMEINLKGTAKQIAWATEIIRSMMPGIEWALENAVDKSQMQKVVDSILNSYAGTVIDAFKGCHLSAFGKENAKEWYAAYQRQQKYGFHKF